MADSKFKKDINIRNRKASYEYQFLDTYIAGIVLSGTEIKSIREGKVNLQESFCLFLGEELICRGMHISPYSMGSFKNHESKADRKLLLKRKELEKIKSKSQEKGLSIIPTRLFINDRGWAKVEIAIAKGKKLYDKREDIKQKDLKRELSNVKTP